MHKSDWEEIPPTEPNSPRLPDPVCGMLVEPRQSAGTRTNHGRSVFFCSTQCLEKFDANPEHYGKKPE